MKGEKMSVKYTSKDVLEMTIQAKGRGASLYMVLARGSENYHVSQLFAKLAHDEQRHKVSLQQWVGSLEASAQQEAYPGERSMFLKSLVDENTYSCTEVEQKAIESSINVYEALKAGINFEKDFMLFLYELKQCVKGDGKEIIDTLLDEETKHLREMFETKDKL
jgi:rubrerythrin